jgi:RNA polymerase sigma factor (sigma-70 family)
VKQPFERVIAEHGQTVQRVCRVVVGVHDADDAWSETFLAALRAYPELPDDANVEAWLVTIAHRKAIDIVRAAQRHALPVAELPERPSAIGNPESRDLDLWDAVAQLPPKQRQAIAYHHLAGLPYAEVAQLLGGTAESARRAASDGIASLRATLAESRGRPAGNAPGGTGRPPHERRQTQGAPS